MDLSRQRYRSTLPRRRSDLWPIGLYPYKNSDGIHICEQTALDKPSRRFRHHGRRFKHELCHGMDIPTFHQRNRIYLENSTSHLHHQCVIICGTVYPLVKAKIRMWLRAHFKNGLAYMFLVSTVLVGSILCLQLSNTRTHSSSITAENIREDFRNTLLNSSF
ncbi:hypothetical protein BC829DRAFT_220796 [Chytridium lagenaria]|nr:hypothetical protein BC829DRAFT_220796 [Chytridium lagenaria]